MLTERQLAVLSEGVFEIDNPRARAVLVALIADVQALKLVIRNLLLSADCTWEAENRGHDWAEACAEARHALDTNLKAAGYD